MGDSCGGRPGTLTVESVLEHYGIKGMKWGVHRRRPKENIHDDAARTKELKARTKRSGTKALSNTELQEAINRMNLEQNYKRLRGNESNLVKRFIAKTLLDVGKQQITSIASEEAGKFVSSRRGK